VLFLQECLNSSGFQFHSSGIQAFLQESEGHQKVLDHDRQWPRQAMPRWALTSPPPSAFFDIRIRCHVADGNVATKRRTITLVIICCDRMDNRAMTEGLANYDHSGWQDDTRQQQLTTWQPTWHDDETHDQAMTQWQCNNNNDPGRQHNAGPGQRPHNAIDEWPQVHNNTLDQRWPAPTITLNQHPSSPLTNGDQSPTPLLTKGNQGPLQPVCPPPPFSIQSSTFHIVTF